MGKLLALCCHVARGDRNAGQKKPSPLFKARIEFVNAV